METYTQYIELINNYLNGKLSNDAQIDIESQLQNDLEFNTIYQEHIIFLNGLNRIEIKADILKAKRSYTTKKWLKISGISIITISILIILYTLIFNTSEIEPASNNDSFNTTLIDAQSIEESSTETIVDSIIIQETTKSEIGVESHISEEKLIAKTNYNPLKKQRQILRINTQNDTVIKCNEGTILKITKGSFINPNTKKIVTGTINLNVTEYYKLSDILMANLSTVSNGKQLETGGMLYIEATQGSTKLELNDSSPIQISFPNQNPKRGMQLFSGEWKEENINWNLQTNDVLESISVSEDIEHNIEVPFSVVEQVPTFPGCENDDNAIRRKCTQDAIQKFINRNFKTEVGFGLGLTGIQRINCIFKINQDGNIAFIRSRAPHPRLSEEADRVIALLPQMSPGMQRGRAVAVPYSLPIRYQVVGGNTIEKKLISKDSVSTQTTITFDARNINQVEMDTIYSDSRGIIETIREVMHDKDFVVDSLFIKEWDQYKKQRLIRDISLRINPNYIGKAVILRKPLFEMENTRFKTLEDDSITRGGHVVRIPWDASKVPTTSRNMRLVPKQTFSAGTEVVTAEKFDELLGETSNTYISSRDVSYYVLKTANLGWINCDRFINGRTKRIKYKLKIKNADGANVSMVFKSLNSVLPSWYMNGAYDFQTVRANEDVILVAIKRKDGKLYYDTIETKTKENPQIDFEFKEVSIEKLKAELEKLNNAFE